MQDVTPGLAVRIDPGRLTEASLSVIGGASN